MESKEYVFPTDNWYLKIDDENREIVNNWRINIIKYSTEPCQHSYINYQGRGGRGLFGGEREISIDQFKEYVLNIPTNPLPKEKEDLSYLINFLQKINIK